MVPQITLTKQKRPKFPTTELEIMSEAILWSAVCRDNIILAEAGEDHYEGGVIKLAQKLLKKKPTAGWEFQRSHRDGLKGIKFHVYDHSGEGGLSKTIWSFAAVAESSLEEVQLKSFLEKLVYVTEPLREENQEWRTGDTLSAQESFAPVLLHLMEEVTRRGKLAMVNEKIDSVKEIMSDNIDKMLERGETLEELDQRAESLSAMSKQFHKRAKQVKRFKAWQNAKHGLVLGTAVTGVVAAVTVPPLIALL